MTEEEISLVVRTLRDMGLTIVETHKLTDDTITIRLKRPPFKS